MMKKFLQKNIPLDITLYGTQTSTYEHLKMSFKELSKQAGINLKVREVDDWEFIVRQNIQSIPAVAVDGLPPISRHRGERLNEFINRVFEIISAYRRGNVLVK